MSRNLSKREEYLEQARQADQKAADTKDYAAAEIWKKVANSYRELARRESNQD